MSEAECAASTGSTSTPKRAAGATIEERVLNTLREAHPEPVGFCYLARHCAGYDTDTQMHIIVCERIIQLSKEGKIIISDDTADQSDIYAPVSLPSNKA